MAEEKLTPSSKSVPSSGGVKDGGKSILTTPKAGEAGDIAWGKDDKDKIMK